MKQKRSRLDVVPQAYEPEQANGRDEESDSDPDNDGEYEDGPTEELTALRSNIKAAVIEDRRQQRDLEERRRTVGKSNGRVRHLLFDNPIAWIN